jgi:type I restriction enzyme, S subunit
MSEISPSQWNQYSLADLAHYYNGVAFGPSDWSDEGIPILRIEQLNNPEAPCDHFKGRCKETNLVDDGDLIFSWSASLKVVVWRHGKAVLNQHLFKVVPRQGFEPGFVRYLLEDCLQSLAADSHGSTMKHIKRESLEKLYVRVPKFGEQSVIFDILLTLDRTIEQIETLTAKMQQVKAGLMHDLFTRGILPNGELRPAREEAPHLYKKSPLGWIPKEWEAVRLPSAMDSEAGIKPGPFGSSLKKNTYVAEGYRVYGQEQVINGSLQTGDYYISERKFTEMKTFEVAAGDVLLSLVGTIGRALVVKWPFEAGIINPRLVRLRPNREQCHPNFISIYLATSAAKRQIDSLFGGGTMPVINGKVIRRLYVPLGRVAEQDMIVSRIEGVERKIAELARELDKLSQIKSGLMHDLLTGRVRIPESMLKRAAVAT